MYRIRELFLKVTNICLTGVLISDTLGWMEYQIVYVSKVRKFLRSLQPKRSQQIRAKVAQLAQDPYAPNNNVKAMKGRDYFRLRVGDYRVVYELDDNRLILRVIEMGGRGDIYS
jgi:mRNA interferase RelE/StbE